MGRHAALDLDADPLDWQSTQQPTEWYAMVEGPTEPVPVKNRAVLPIMLMFLGAGFSAVLLVLLVKRWPGPINLVTGLTMIGLAVVPFLTAMLGMLLLHWREL